MKVGRQYAGSIYIYHNQMIRYAMNQEEEEEAIYRVSQKEMIHGIHHLGHALRLKR